MAMPELDVNIYALDQDPRRAAQYHNDRHVSKQILTMTQILTAAHVVSDGLPTAKARVLSVGAVQMPEKIYGHVCVSWVRAASDNYRWAWYLLDDLIEESNMRFKKTHSYSVLRDDLFKKPFNMPMGPLSPWAQYLPRPFVRADPIEAYRLFYVHKKRHLAQWSKPSIVPSWWIELSNREKLREQESA